MDKVLGGDGVVGDRRGVSYRVSQYRVESKEDPDICTIIGSLGNIQYHHKGYHGHHG